jgi:GNAT superfamily N-acetyltransferase
MDLRPVLATDAARIAQAALFARCFPQATHLDAAYLQWLYAANPAGDAHGVEAWDGERLAAHYACIPAPVVLGGAPVRALLSLNTATDPDYQGRGLFVRLAEATYAQAADAGIACVFGVANAQSTPGFLRKLGFTLVGPLECRVGFGRLRGVDLIRAHEQAAFRREWDATALAWRAANPARPLRASTLPGGGTAWVADTGRAGMLAWAELPLPPPADSRTAPWRPRVFLGAMPTVAGRLRGDVSVPMRLRPSPLNLIVRDLRGFAAPSRDDVFFSFLDFDAF